MGRRQGVSQFRAGLASLLLCAAVFAFAAPASAETGLVGRWPLDTLVNTSDGLSLVTPEAGGDPAFDAAQFTGATVVPGGRFGSAADFPTAGANGSRFGVQDLAALEPAQLTVALWVRHDGSPGVFKWVIARGAQGCEGASYGMSTGGDGALSFVIRDAGTFHVTQIAGTSVWDGRWHAVAGTFDGATMRTYLDGAPVAAVAQPNPIAYALQFQTLNLGNYPGSGFCAFDYTFPGLLDEVRIYDRALSPAQVAHLQDPGATQPPNVDDTPGPGAPPPGGGAATTVTGLRPAAKVVANRPIVMQALVSGPAAKLEWNLTGDARPEVVSEPGQTALAFRPAGASATVGVRPVIPGQAPGAYVSQTVTVPAAAGAQKLPAKLVAGAAALGPVYATGPPEQLVAVSAAALKNVCALVGTTVHHEGVRYTGCLRPILKLDDIPERERGIVRELATLRLLTRQVPKDQRIAYMAGPGLNLLDGYVSIGPVTVNGLELSPQGSAVVVVYPAGHAVASSNSGLSIGGMRLQSRTNFTLDTRPTGDRIPLGRFPLAAGGLRALAGFALAASDVQVSLVPGADAATAGALIDVGLKLPSWLQIGGVTAEGRVVVRAQADGRLVLTSLRIGPISARLADALDVTGLQLDYTQAADEWRGQGKICLVGGTCLDMIPPNGGVTIRGGALKGAGATLTFPPPGIALFPGLALERIGFGVFLDPTVVTGNARVTALKLYEIDGRLLLAFPSTAAPYVFAADTAGTGFPPEFYGRVHTRPTIAISAEAALKVPAIGSIPLGGGHFLYEYPGYVAFGGGVSQEFFDVVKLSGGVRGELNAANGRFSLVGSVEACVVGLCRGAIGVISNRGVGGCLSLGPLNVGGGVLFSPFEVILWPLDGCKWSRFTERNVRGARAAQAGAPYTVQVARSGESRAIRLDGAAEAPRVRVTGPGGQTLDSTPATGVATGGALRIMRSVEQRRTVVGLQDPRAGEYVITPLDGAAPPARIAEAADPPDARVTAAVGGDGTERTLRYDVGERANQRVTFVEVAPTGSRTIGTVTGGGRGVLRFTSAPGRGVRRVQAQFELGGLPAERRTVARFAAAPARLTAPAAVRVVRRGTTLRATWARVPGAARYEIVVTRRGGRQRLRRTSARELRITGVAASEAGRVTVRGVAPLQDGRARGAAFGRARPLVNRVGRLQRL